MSARGQRSRRVSRDPHDTPWPVCHGRLVVAPLWVAFGANLGTLLRTCDALGACMAVPDTPHYRAALAKGDTLDCRPCIHRVRTGKDQWIARQQALGWRIVAVELTPGSVPLAQLAPASGPTVVLLGHEWNGVPDHHVGRADDCVEIPMHGVGHSLNVAVAGSLVLYKLAGLA